MVATRVAGVERSLRRGRAPTATWGFAHVVLVACCMAAILFLSAVAWPPRRDDSDLAATLARTALALGGGALVIAATALRTSPDRWRALGLEWRGSLRGAIGGWVAYAAMVPGMIGLALVARWVLERIGVEFETQLVVRKFLAMPEAEVPIVIVLGVFVMPFLEELTFRAFLQPVLVRRAGPVLGIALTSSGFAALHGASAFLPIFGLSFVLGAVMQSTGRLLASWAVHALHNGLVFGVLVFLRHHPELIGHSALLALR